MNIETKIAFVTFLVLLPASLLLLRIIALLPSSRRYHKSSLDGKLNEVKGSSIMVLLGSGGHTGEMMRILSPIDLSSCTRTWVVSSGDTTSLLKAKAYEVNLKGGKAQFIELKRARKVGEPLSLSVKSTIMSFISTVQQVWKLAKPDVLLVNGPGTCIPLAYVLFIMKLLGLCNTRIIYIESLARVNNLSLSGRLILPISERFLVQWRSLAEKYQRVEYYGILI
ncbi:CIC11C00000002840 [Sungouiella intermedia]|uniref:UDP-N-acetylglucosamine transferase subunit ALG14 n=1 Tax=Sungouiella intermedia TaxID=45354 RepID=A0A1L0C7K3_9ASCO|nr:CIC11C00000002840 [[Candida] intermedia]